MAPRVGNTASGVGDPAFKFVLSVLKHCDQVKTDWNEVAKENGIAYARNATARFKSIIENNGLKFENGAVIIPDGLSNNLASNGNAPSTANGGDDEPKPPRRAKQAPRKRKSPAEDGTETAAAAASVTKRGSAKKKMKSESIVKGEEEGAEEEVAVPAKEEDAANADTSGESIAEKAKVENEA